MNDTPLSIVNRMLGMLTTRTPVERLKMTSSMFDSGKTLLLMGLRRENPTFNNSQLRCLLLRRLYGDCFNQIQLERILRCMPDMQQNILPVSPNRP